MHYVVRDEGVTAEDVLRRAFDSSMSGRVGRSLGRGILRRARLRGGKIEEAAPADPDEQAVQDFLRKIGLDA